MGKSTLKKSLR